MASAGASEAPPRVTSVGVDDGQVRTRHVEHAQAIGQRPLHGYRYRLPRQPDRSAEPSSEKSGGGSTSCAMATGTARQRIISDPEQRLQ